ncbi:asparagine synthase-related protein [Labilibaculum euxinus]
MFLGIVGNLSKRIRQKINNGFTGGRKISGLDSPNYMLSTFSYTGNGQFDNLVNLKETENHCILSDCSLFNRADLFHKLHISPKLSSDISDAHLILRAYEKWGNDCPGYLEGEFSFAIWDKKKKELFAARDHMGFRPFYYHQKEDQLFFACDIQLLMATGEISKKINEKLLISYLTIPDKIANETILTEVCQLEPGHSIFFRALNGIQKRCYWKAEPGRLIQFSNDDDYACALRELMEESVGNRIPKEGNMGVLLSGGLDSSTLACIAARQLKKQGRELYAFSSVSDDRFSSQVIDEFSYIREVLNQEENIKYTPVKVGNDNIFETPCKSYDFYPAPFNAFHYMDLALMNAAQDQHVKVLMNGMHGDLTVSYKAREALLELFSGLQLRKAHKLTREMSTFHDKSYVGILKSHFLGKAYHQFLNRNGKQIQNAANSVLQGDYSEFNENHSRVTNTSKSKGLARDRLLANKVHSNIARERIIGAHYGILPARPFMDKKIVDFLINIPVEKYWIGGQQRGLIRQAMFDILPSKIRDRKDKTPFCPDFNHRLMELESYVQNTLFQYEMLPVSSQIIDGDKVRGRLNDLVVRGEGIRFGDNTFVPISKAVIFINYLKWVDQNGYVL